MLETATMLKNAADKCGLLRVKATDNKVPFSQSDITVMPFFGNIHSTFVLSSLLLRRFKEESKASKYFILCSWPGYQGAFPYVDEYWSIKPEMFGRWYWKANEFNNDCDLQPQLIRNLHNFFEDVILPETLFNFYESGFKQQFFDKFRNIKYFLPMVPSSVILGIDFNKEMAKRSVRKVFVYPVTKINSWRRNEQAYQIISKDFWVALLKRLVDEGYCPVVYQSELTHNVMDELLDKCLYVRDQELSHILSVMRSCGCVLDIFSGISRLAIMARCPFVFCDERNRYSSLKEYEIDDICAEEIPRQYLFTFSPITDINNKFGWNYMILDGIMNKLDLLLSSLDREALPPPSEVNKMIVYKDQVRKVNIRQRLGMQFINIPKI